MRAFGAGRQADKGFHDVGGHFSPAGDVGYLGCFVCDRLNCSHCRLNSSSDFGTRFLETLFQPTEDSFRTLSGIWLLNFDIRFRVLSRLGLKGCSYRCSLLPNKVHRLLNSCPNTHDEALPCLPMPFPLNHGFPRWVIRPYSTIHIPTRGRRNRNMRRREKCWGCTGCSGCLPYRCWVFVKPIRFEEFEGTIRNSTICCDNKYWTTWITVVGKGGIFAICLFMNDIFQCILEGFFVEISVVFAHRN